MIGEAFRGSREIILRGFVALRQAQGDKTTLRQAQGDKTTLRQAQGDKIFITWQRRGNVTAIVVCCHGEMTDRQYKDLFQAILDLREATEFGFTNVDRRFNELEERWDRRFRALESRVEDGFHDVCNHFTQVDLRLGTLEDRIGTISSRLRNVEQT